MTNDTKGTPDTLHQALVNGLLGSTTVLMGPYEADRLATELIPHVRDFLAQKMGCLTMSKIPIVADVSMEMWNQMFPPKASRK